MVLKPTPLGKSTASQFENDVNMYGTQARGQKVNDPLPFENDVNMYGTQASVIVFQYFSLFENDVNMYGTQASMNA